MSDPGVGPFEEQLRHIKRVQTICGGIVLMVAVGFPFIPVTARTADERRSMTLSLLVVGGLIALGGVYLLWRGLRTLAGEPALVLLTRTPERITSFHVLRTRTNGIHTKTAIVLGLRDGRSVQAPIPIAKEAAALAHLWSLVPGGG